MNICIVGLGLIGGSFAKAISKRTKNSCFGMDIDKETERKAAECGAIKKAICATMLAEMDMVVIALPPKATVNFFVYNKNNFKKGAIVFDTCGIKKRIIDEISPHANECGIRYVGAHPMAGREFSGFDFSLETLFDNASFIVVEENTDKIAFDAVCLLATQIGFKTIQITTAAEHDKIIAYTSQLAHIVSSSYCKSPNFKDKDGFCAGSFADMTRVAKLDVKLWTELLSCNAEPLCCEIENIIAKLSEFDVALKNKDESRLAQLLKEGNDLKVDAP